MLPKAQSLRESLADPCDFLEYSSNTRKKISFERVWVDAMCVHILIACPRPNEVDKEAMVRTFPFGIKTIELKQGGMVSEGIHAQQSGDKRADALVATAAVRVSVDIA